MLTMPVTLMLAAAGLLSGAMAIALLSRARQEREILEGRVTSASGRLPVLRRRAQYDTFGCEKCTTDSQRRQLRAYCVCDTNCGSYNCHPRDGSAAFSFKLSAESLPDMGDLSDEGDVEGSSWSHDTLPIHGKAVMAELTAPNQQLGWHYDGNEWQPPGVLLMTLGADDWLRQLLTQELPEPEAQPALPTPPPAARKPRARKPKELAGKK